jgi:hypothetical protein
MPWQEKGWSGGNSGAMRADKELTIAVAAGNGRWENAVEVPTA